MKLPWNKPMDMGKFKKILCLDFDGVIHSYASGWKGPWTIPDPPVRDAILWLQQFLLENCDPPEEYCSMAPDMPWRVCIFSSRSKYPFARRRMRQYLIENGLDAAWAEMIDFPTSKPPATVTIDDRAIQFNGRWNAGLKDMVLNFQPWNRR